MKFHLSLSSVVVVLAALFLAACDAPPAYPTLTVPTQAAPPPTSIPPTAIPTNTVFPPTSTATVVPPTATPTLVPPTVTPTVAPTTAVPPTKVPPTAAPPVVLSPTLVLARQVNGGFVSAFGWSSDNSILSVQTESAITRYNVSDLKAVTSISPTFAAQIYAMSADGTQVFGMAPDNSYKTFSTVDGKPIVTFEITGGPIPGAVFTPDGSMVATFGGDEIEVNLWDAKTGKPVKTLTGFETAAPVYSAIFSSDNKTMAWISRATVQFMQVDNGALGTKLQFEDFVSAAQFTPDGRSFVTVNVATVNNQPNGVVQVWGVNDGRMQQQLTTPQFFAGLSVAPTGTRLAAGVNESVALWEWKAGGAATYSNAPGQISTLAFSQDGKLLASGDQDGNIVVWDVVQ